MIINYRENNHHFGGFIVNWHKRFYFVVGGYGSSKSYNTALKLLIKARDEKKRKILVVRKTFESLRDSCFDLLCEIIETSGMSKEFKITSTPMRIIHKKTKSRFIFRGLDKPEKLKSIHGVSIVWIEEAPEISYEAFKELNGRLRTMEQSMHIIMSSNPVSKSSWTYKHFFLDKEMDDNELYHKRIIKTEDTYYHHSTVDDNKFVPAEYKQQLEQLQHHDPDLYRIARKGRFGILGEKLFRNVENKSHSEVMEEVEKINCRDRYDGLDFGFSVSFNALVRCAVDRQNNHLYIYKEWHEKELINSEVTEKVVKLLQGTYHSVIADNARPELIEELSRNKIRIERTKKVANNKVIGANKIKSFYKIIVSDECPQTFKDLTELTFKKDKNDEIIEDKFSFDSHIFDALAYSLENYVQTNLKHGKIQRPKGW